MSSIILLILITFTNWSEPVLILELWPCEGHPQFESTGQELRLHAEPDRKSTVIRSYRPRRGRRILWDKTEYQTIAPAIVKVLRPVTLDGRSFGRICRITSNHYYRGYIENRKLRFKPGEQFEYLQYRAEGACIIRIEDEAIEVERCRWIEDNNNTFEMSGEPKTEWWVRVIEANKSLGWLLIDNTHIKWLDRSF